VSEGRFPDGSQTLRASSTTPARRGNVYPLQAVVISEVLSHADDPFEDANFETVQSHDRVRRF